MSENDSIANIRDYTNEDPVESNFQQELENQGYNFLGKRKGFLQSWNHSRSDTIVVQRFVESVNSINDGDFVRESLESAARKIISRCSIPRKHIGNEDELRDVVNKRKEGLYQILRGFSNDITAETETGEERVPTFISDNISENTFDFARQVPYTSPVTEERRRFDIVLYINGIPFFVLELKSQCNSRGVADAKEDLELYHRQVPSYFVLPFTSGAAVDFELGEDEPFYYKAYMAPSEQYNPWYNDNENSYFERGKNAVAHFSQQKRLIEMYKYGQFFLQEERELKQIVARHHQYFSIRKLVSESTDNFDQLRDSGASRNGIVRKELRNLVWHTQGSGKTYTMLFAIDWLTDAIKKLHGSSEFQILLLVDRRDLSESLANELRNATSSLNITSEVIGDSETKDDFISAVEDGTNDVILSTIQTAGYDKRTDTVIEKPVILLEDEIHRESLKDQGARVESHFPNSLRFGFTGTPTDEVVQKFSSDIEDFEFLHKYLMKQGLREDMIVPVSINDVEPSDVVAELEAVDKEFMSRMKKYNISEEEVSESVQSLDRTLLERNWSELHNLFIDFVVSRFKLDHAETSDVSMVVCSSREKVAQTARDLKKELGDQKVTAVMSTQPKDSKSLRRAVEHDDSTVKRKLSSSEDPLKIVVVCDKFLTGFDEPKLASIFLNKPLSKEHRLKQAIARVNRPRTGKTHGTIYDFQGVARDIERALHTEEFETVKISSEEALSEYISSLDECLGVLSVEDWSELDNKLQNDMIHEVFKKVHSDEDVQKEFVSKFRKARKFRQISNLEPGVLEHENKFRILKSIYNSCTPSRTISQSETISEEAGDVLDSTIEIDELNVEQESKIDVDTAEEQVELSQYALSIQTNLKRVENQTGAELSERVQKILELNTSSDEKKRELEDLEDDVDRMVSETLPTGAHFLVKDLGLNNEKAIKVYEEISQFDCGNSNSTSIASKLWREADCNYKEIFEDDYDSFRKVCGRILTE